MYLLRRRSEVTDGQVALPLLPVFVVPLMAEATTSDMRDFYDNKFGTRNLIVSGQNRAAASSRTFCS
jgi:hypothetical protein